MRAERERERERENEGSKKKEGIVDEIEEKNKKTQASFSPYATIDADFPSSTPSTTSATESYVCCCVAPSPKTPSGKEKLLASFEGGEEAAAAVGAVAAVALVAAVEEAFPTPLRVSPLPHGVGWAHLRPAAAAAFASLSPEESGLRRTTTLAFVFFLGGG